MKNISIAQRLSLTLALAFLSMIGVGAYGVWNLGAAQDRFEFVQTSGLPSVHNLAEQREVIGNTRAVLRDHILADTDEAKKGFAQKFQELQKEIEKLFVDYEKSLIADDTDRKMFQADKELFASYTAKAREVIEKSSRNNVKEAYRIVQDGMSGPLTTALAKHIEYNEKLIEETRRDNEADYRLARQIQIAVIVLSLLVCGALGFIVAREIAVRMNRLSHFMTEVEETLDFTKRIKIMRLDELGKTGTAFNKLLDRLQDNLKTIADRVQSVATSANAMATTSGQVATASHLQSESASNMAATVEEMTVSINHVADRAQEADRISGESGKLASAGEKIIGQTTGDIQEISATVNAASGLIHGLEQHSQQISHVVQVIKDVADQTNLLALNAAIEAARAGEQGRGFAVVADEVRKLAERTTASTQEISATIETMRSSASNAVDSMKNVVDKVTIGVERAQEANRAIQQIGEGSRSAVAMVEEIAEAIREQGSATNNIATQVERIAQMSEESSAAAGNSAQAATDLDQLAKEMQRIVSAYRL